MTQITYQSWGMGGVTGKIILYNRQAGDKVERQYSIYDKRLTMQVLSNKDVEVAQKKEAKLYKLLQMKKSPFVYQTEIICQ